MQQLKKSMKQKIIDNRKKQLFLVNIFKSLKLIFMSNIGGYVPSYDVIKKPSGTFADAAAAGATLAPNTAKMVLIGSVKTHVKKDALGVVSSQPLT